MCLASTLPSAGGSKFDNSALIDANFERMRVFARARHLMSFDIRYYPSNDALSVDTSV
jgi:hypothetical protein